MAEHPVRFAFIGEGPSDRGIIPVLETLCVRHGATEATGFVPGFERLPYRVARTVHARLRAAIEIEPMADFVCIHRDADSPDARPRLDEIRRGAVRVASSMRTVPIVPVQEMEAWLLVDEAAIRRAAGNARGSRTLALPKPARVEGAARPKEILIEALCDASELTGRRLKRFRGEFSEMRQMLLQGIDVDGPVRALPAWKALDQEIGLALDAVRKRRTESMSDR